MWSIAGPTCAERLDGELVERPRSGQRAEDDEHRHVVGQLEDLARLGLRNRLRARRDRAADDAVRGCPFATASG